MFPQKSSKVGPLVGLIALLFAIYNPTGAAGMVNRVVSAVGQFAGALG